MKRSLVILAALAALVLAAPAAAIPIMTFSPASATVVEKQLNCGTPCTAEAGVPFRMVGDPGGGTLTIHMVPLSTGCHKWVDDNADDFAMGPEVDNAGNSNSDEVFPAELHPAGVYDLCAYVMSSHEVTEETFPGSGQYYLVETTYQILAESVPMALTIMTYEEAWYANYDKEIKAAEEVKAAEEAKQAQERAARVEAETKAHEVQQAEREAIEQAILKPAKASIPASTAADEKLFCEDEPEALLPNGTRCPNTEPAQFTGKVTAPPTLAKTQKLAKALKQCKKLKKHSKRVACEKRAKRRYKK